MKKIMLRYTDKIDLFRTLLQKHYHVQMLFRSQRF